MIDQPVQLQDPLRQPPSRRPWRWWQMTLIGLGAAVLIGGLTGLGLLWHFSKDLPGLDQLGPYQPSLGTRVYSFDQRLIGHFLMEGRTLTPAGEIPERLGRGVMPGMASRFFDSPALACL